MLRLNIFLAVLCSLSWTRTSVSATPVYGFAGALSALPSGRPLHYIIRLGSCTELNGASVQEDFTETFGSRVETYRSFNDKDIAAIPFFVFYEQTMMFNATGGLVHLSREVEIWENDTAIVSTLVYNPDFTTALLSYAHQCTMSTADTKGDIDLETSKADPQHAKSFSEVVDALEDGSSVHFSAMTFICKGGREHSFMNFGGRFSNYEVTVVDSEVKVISSSIQQTAHYDRRRDMHVVDILNLRLHDNKTVEVMDTRGRPPYLEHVYQHVSYCYLETGAPGGSFNVLIRSN